MRFTFGRSPLLAAGALTAGLAFAPLAAQQPQERIDYDAIYRIKDEGFRRSRVMEITSWLTDVYGPRLTNSPGFRKAGEWAVKEMASWGLANVTLEPFGPFGTGWANEKFYMAATTPGGTFPVIGMSTAWTPGTEGAVAGDAIFAVLDTDEDLAKFKGTLKGKVVLTQAFRDVPALWTPPARRYTEQQLAEMEQETDATPRGRGGRAGGRLGGRGGPAGAPGAETFTQRR